MWSFRPWVPGPEVLEEVLAGVGLAVAVGVAEDGQAGHVHDVERAVVPGHAEDGAEALGEDDRVLALAEEEDPAEVGLVGADLVHRVLGDEQRPVGRGRDLAGVEEVGEAGDEADLEAIGDLGQASRRSRRRPGRTRSAGRPRRARAIDHA